MFIHVNKYVCASPRAPDLGPGSRAADNRPWALQALGPGPRAPDTGHRALSSGPRAPWASGSSREDADSHSDHIVITIQSELTD